MMFLTGLAVGGVLGLIAGLAVAAYFESAERGTHQERRDVENQ